MTLMFAIKNWFVKCLSHLVRMCVPVDFFNIIVWVRVVDAIE